MADDNEVDKYKRLYEEQRAKVKDLERQNSQLKDVIQQLMEAARQAPANRNPAATGAGGRGRSRPGPSRTNNPSASVNSGGRGRGNASSNQRPGAAGGGQAIATGTRSGEGSVQESRDPSAATGEALVAAAAAAAAARNKQESTQPPEPDVRNDIVSQMREASMSKDRAKLEAAIKKAEDAGLHFEANQGRRQLSRISG
ncbi:unnamed protein product [Ascophyllum nodosum]